MPNFKFIGALPRFYPDERDASGKSLMAELGTVHDWAVPPSDGQWVETDEAPQAPPVDVPQEAVKAVEEVPEAPAPVVVPPPAPEPAPVLPQTPEPAPVPEVARVVPEPAQAPAQSPELTESESVAEAAQEPVQAPLAPEAPKPFMFPGFAPASQPYTR